MRICIARQTVALLPLLLFCGGAFAQTTQPDDDRMTRLERRLDEMEQRHQQELKARDAEIARLRAMLTVAGGEAVEVE